MVSVIVPVYNAEKFIKRCIDSILCQTYKDFELILINDGSKDSSLEIIQKYVEIDQRITVLSQENKGVSYTRNFGLDIAKGDYIMFVDSDDWIEANMIQTLVSNIEKTNADISCCQYDKMVRDDIGELEIWSRNEFLTTFIKHKKINGSLVNKLIKRDLIADTRFENSIRYGEDALFLWKLLLKTNSLCITNMVLYHVVLHDDSASGSGSYKSIRIDCIKVWQTITDDASTISEDLCNLARAQLANMAFYSIYEMQYYNYKNASDEKLFKTVLKDNFKFLMKSNFIRYRVKFYAFLLVNDLVFGIKIINYFKNISKKI